MAKTILVVDDKANMRTLVSDYLTEENFHVISAEDGQQALYVARREKPDLVLLDIMMPKMGGYEFLRAFRREYGTPVIVLTARLEESDKVLGLELGADDYITKPFGMRELVARIRAVLRRSEGGAPVVSLLRAGELTVDRDTREVRAGDTEVSLTPTEFDLLTLLMTTPGRVFSRLDLLELLQGTDFDGVARTIDVHVRNLRCKIEKDPAHPIYIETVFGVGYRFRPEKGGK